jgi:hypothetical protein
MAKKTKKAAPKKAGRKKKYTRVKLVKHGVLSIIEGD